MSIISQNQQNEELISTISRFFKDFKVGDLLRKCNATKEKGVPVLDIFKYKLCNVFNGRSMYMQMQTGSYREGFSKNSYYRFLNLAKVNWLRFTTLLAKKASEYIEPLTSEERVNAFIVDDSLFERTSCKATELCARVFDHCTMKYKKGFRLLTLLWTDGNTAIPVNGSLLSSAQDKNVLGPQGEFDGRSLAGRRRKMSREKGPAVMVELIQRALSAGIKAEYVLFDTWFSAPAQLMDMHKLGLKAIARIKKSGKIYYGFEGERLSLAKIYSQCKKRRGKSRYLLSVEVLVEHKGESIPAKIVYVRNKNKRKEWIAFISTDTGLSEDEIMRIYGKRWQIESFFKTCKSTLNLVGECRSLSYDALTAHVAVVFSRYVLLALTSRQNVDQRTLGEIFFFLVDEMEDITLGTSLAILWDIMFDAFCHRLNPSEAQENAIIADIIDALPEYMSEALLKAA